jgi:hypothetical protein
LLVRASFDHVVGADDERIGGLGLSPPARNRSRRALGLNIPAVNLYQFEGYADIFGIWLVYRNAAYRARCSL